ncbi:MAG: tRNA (N6-adenosine(37)-N6)-threonylcarbamoyltransferase complex ATPase TsaE [marine bacterium B5-7]|nr:MAG: tRNA (N6-adenosine(37)-N6)-threonylcarbamoyltransferase complex ATPase TsaE [marine bacterium B5-7]
MINESTEAMKGPRTESRVFRIDGERAMIEFGQSLALDLDSHELVFVKGDLGAGKTTLVRGILMGLGHQGSVPSPTFTLVEPYDINDLVVYHLDLYRLESPHELDMLGARDFIGMNLCLIEWPERGAGWLPKADRVIEIRGSAAVYRDVTVIS